MMDEYLFRPGIDIAGRPDRSIKDFGVGITKKHLPYVHSTSHNACLIHKVNRVKIRWYAGHYDWMERLDPPHLIAETVCGRFVYLSNGKKSGKMCEVPDPNAVLCGRCHGEIATFSRRRIIRIKRQWAKDHLGCKGVHEVIGPYKPKGAA